MAYNPVTAVGSSIDDVRHKINPRVGDIRYENGGLYVLCKTVTNLIVQNAAVKLVAAAGEFVVATAGANETVFGYVQAAVGIDGSVTPKYFWVQVWGNGHAFTSVAVNNDDAVEVSAVGLVKPDTGAGYASAISTQTVAVSARITCMIIGMFGHDL